jgi:hypothetical protein
VSVFVDSNIPMYLVGAEHPNKEISQRRLDDLITSGERLVTDAEVLQEILHRYLVIKRLDAIQPVFDVLLGVVDEVLPVGLAEVEDAKQILFGGYDLSAREAVHVAVMRGQQIDRILSFDTGFDTFPGITRI